MAKLTIKDKIKKVNSNNNMRVIYHYYYEKKFYTKHAHIKDLYNEDIAFNRNRFFKVVKKTYKTIILPIRNKAKKICVIEDYVGKSKDIHSYINPLPYYHYNREE